MGCACLITLKGGFLSFILKGAVPTSTGGGTFPPALPFKTFPYFSESYSSFNFSLPQAKPSV
jgi:hypothetical protein